MLNFGNKEFRNLQEQVLKNAQDIQILKERPGLKPVVVTELPAIGEENILYLVPKNPDPDTSDADSYDEYIWIPETQTYEFVGSTALNLSNMVTTDTEQTITGAKSFTSDVNVNNINVSGGVKFSSHTLTEDSGYFAVKDGPNSVALIGSDLSMFRTIVPSSTNTYNLGRNDFYWKDLYLAGQINFSSGPSIKQDSSNRIVITGANGQDRIKVGGVDSTYCAANWTPDQDNKYSLGKSNMRWKDLYLSGRFYTGTGTNQYIYGDTYNRTGINNGFWFSALRMEPMGGDNTQDIGMASNRIRDLYLSGNISDGTNSVSVADIVTKPNFNSPTVYASGTLDVNGEGTIDIATLGVPTPGLYEFNYGGCQCYVTFTTENIQNAATTPIIVSCPVLKDNSQYAGYLKITRNADILTLTIASSVGPVSESGIPWNLYKVM